MTSDAERIKELEQQVADLTADNNEYDRLIWRQGNLLTDAVNVLRGPPPELTTWSVHDVAEHAREAVKRRLEAEERYMRLSHIILFGAATQGCNWATDGSPESHRRIYNETLRLVAEKSVQYGYDQGAFQ